MKTSQKWWLAVLTIIVVILSVAVVSAYCNGISFKDNSASVLISALGVMVTALVGWQVYNAISYEKRIAAIEESANRHALYGDARICFTQGLLICTVTDSQIEVKGEETIKNYCIAYRNFLEALIKYQSSKLDSQPMISCCENMNKCLKKVEKKQSVFQKEVYEQCDKLYNDFLFREKELLVSQEMLSRLFNLNKRRKKLKQYNSLLAPAQPNEGKRSG